MALRRGESAAGEIIPLAGLSKPSLSKHLRALQQAGVVAFRRKGTHLMYRLNTHALKPVEQFVDALRPRG